MFEFEINSTVGKFYILSEEESLSFMEVAYYAAKWGKVNPDFTFSMKRRYIG